MGFQVWGLGFRVQGLGFRVQGLGFILTPKEGLGFILTPKEARCDAGGEGDDGGVERPISFRNAYNL